MKVWDRRFAIFVLASTVALTAVPAAHAAARTGRGSARAGGQTAGLAASGAAAGILSVTFSFFHTLVEEAIAVASPAPVPGGPRMPAPTPTGGIGGIGDNGAGIDPNGG
jgi:hypothetical protein